MRVAAALAIALFVVLGGFYWYYQDSQDTISTLQQNNAELENAVKINEATIDSIQKSYNNARKELEQVNAKFKEIRQQNNVLANKLEEHDLGVLAEAKPGLVRRIVNSATDKVNRCFEVASGAPLTEAEKNAETPEKANSECPWLFDTSTNN